MYKEDVFINVLLLLPSFPITLLNIVHSEMFHHLLDLLLNKTVNDLLIISQMC